MPKRTTKKATRSNARKAVRARDEAAKEMPMLEDLPEGPLPPRGGQSPAKPRRGESRVSRIASRSAAGR